VLVDYRATTSILPVVVRGLFMENTIDEFVWAMSQYENVRRVLRKNAEEAAALIQALVPSGVYQYFKGTVLEPERYLVIGPAEEMESGIWRVVCVSLKKGCSGSVSIWPLLSKTNGFLLPVNERRYRGRRFVLEHRLPLGRMFQQIPQYVPMIPR